MATLMAMTIDQLMARATGQQGQWQWKWGNNRRQNNVDVYFMARILNVMYCG
jgi:hypothetical protein